MNISPTVEHWVHDLSPFLIQFSDSFGIRWYGIAYIAGFFMTSWYLGRYEKSDLLPLNKDERSNLLFYLILGVLIGGRLGYFVFYTPESILTDPLSLFKVWEGGMASHGGMLGVLVVILIFSKKKKISFFTLSDLIISTVPAGLFFGRIANFINGELWGKVSNVSWAVIFPQSAPPNTPVELIPPRHPSQLYEAATEGLFLWIYLQIRLKMMSRKNHPKWGVLSGEFLVGYGFWRIVCEQFREPDDGISLILGLSRGSFYSTFMIVAGLIIWVIAHKQAKKKLS